MPLRLLLALTFVVSGAVGLGYLLSADNTVRFSWITGESEGRSPAPFRNRHHPLQARAGRIADHGKAGTL